MGGAGVDINHISIKWGVGWVNINHIYKIRINHNKVQLGVKMQRMDGTSPPLTIQHGRVSGIMEETTVGTE